MFTMTMRCQGNSSEGGTMVISKAIHFEISTKVSHHHLGYSTKNCLTVKNPNVTVFIKYEMQK